MRFVIKICGVTTPDDAALVAAAGADAIGLNFWSGSKRYVGSDAAASAVLAAIPAGVLRVGVFVNASADEVEATARRLGLDRVQLHGDERPDEFRRLPAELVMRAIRVRDQQSFAEANAWAAKSFLYDAFVAGYGGAGEIAPWSVVASEASSSSRPFLLAGGLEARNVHDAIAATRPSGVDVASGVEEAPGRKDPARVHAFIAAARAAALVFPPRYPLS